MSAENAQAALARLTDAERREAVADFAGAVSLRAGARQYRPGTSQYAEAHRMGARLVMAVADATGARPEDVQARVDNVAALCGARVGDLIVRAAG